MTRDIHAVGLDVGSSHVRCVIGEAADGAQAEGGRDERNQDDDRDFEGEVRFGIGVADRSGFRVSELRNPTRVAIDVR